MDSETSAYASAQQKHNKYMVFGKKHRYIEVFQCSGDDMNLVLHGGLHPPANTSKPALLSPGMLTTAQQPQHSQSIPSHSQHHSITVPPPLTLSIPPQNSALIAQQQAQFIAQQNLIARQQAAAAAAHHQEQMFLQNFGLLHPQQQQHQAAAAASLMQQQQQQQQHLSPHHQQPFLLMQRPMLPQLPVGFMPPAWMQFGGHPGMVAAAQMAQQQAAAAQQQAQQQQIPGPSMQTTTKRRYENAFQQDPNALNIPKRTFTTQPGLYPFYPPNV